MKNILSVFFLGLIFACTNIQPDSDASYSFSGNMQITEAAMKSYISLFKKLKAETHEVLELINEGEQSAKQHPDYPRLISIIEEFNFTPEDFFLLSQKIASVYCLSEVNMQTYQELNQNSQNQFSDGAEEFRKMLDDPGIPEDKKRRSEKQL